MLQRDLAAGEDATPGERSLAIQRGDKEVWLSVSEAVMLDATGAVAGRVFAFRDVSSERVVEQMKSDFVATVSHELRTPLTSIYGFAETLMRGDVEFADPERKTFLSYIASESERLINIVDDLLSVARLETGTLRLNIEQLDIGVVAGEVVARVQEHAERWDASSWTFERRSHRRRRPREALAGSRQPRRQRGQVLARGRAVSISARRRPESVEVRISDQGVGIPRADQQRIFSKFYRAESNVRACTGRGSGSSSPAACCSPWAGRSGSSRRKARDRASCSSYRPRRAAPRCGSGEGDRLMALTVLVIDDEAPIRLLCRVNLEAEGETVLEAEDGHIGLEVARLERPDAILLDVMMPGLDGWWSRSSCSRTRRRAGSRSSSSLRGRTSATAPVASAPGGLDYITKPFNPVELAALVEEVVQAVKRGEREELRAEQACRAEGTARDNLRVRLGPAGRLGEHDRGEDQKSAVICPAEICFAEPGVRDHSREDGLDHRHDGRARGLAGMWRSAGS